MAGLSDEQYASICNCMSFAAYARWEKMSAEEYLSICEAMCARWENSTDEEYDAVRSNMSVAAIKLIEASRSYVSKAVDHGSIPGADKMHEMLRPPAGPRLHGGTSEHAVFHLH